MTSQLREMLAELRNGLEKLYGDRLEGLVLFGSRARGDADPDSDVDVTVVLAGEVVPSVEIARTGALVSELSLAYDTVISCVFFSAERYRSRESSFLTNIRRDGVAV